MASETFVLMLVDKSVVDQGGVREVHSTVIQVIIGIASMLVRLEQILVVIFYHGQATELLLMLLLPLLRVNHGLIYRVQV